MAREPYYAKDGSEIPGVTTVIDGNLGWNKWGLNWWYWDQGRQGKRYRESSDDAAAIGSLAHLGVEASIKKEPFEVNELGLTDPDRDRVKRCLDLFGEWRSTTKLQLLHSELRLVSDQFGYGGTLDIVGLDYQGRMILVDLKTGKVYLEAVIQIAAYGALWNEHHPDKPIQGYHLIRVGRENAKFIHHYWPTQEMATPFLVFLHLLELRKAKELMKGLL